MAVPLKLSRRYTYDAENQVTSVTYEDGVVVSFMYDKAGNRIAVTRSGSPGAVVPLTGAIEAEPQQQTTTPSPAPAALQVCGNCGNPLTPGKKFCSNCGAPLSAPSAPQIPVPSQPVCPACGSPVRPGAKFCPKCGRKMS